MRYLVGFKAMGRPTGTLGPARGCPCACRRVKSRHARTDLESDAESLPFEDESNDVVISSIGAGHVKALYGPTIATRANAAKTGRKAELDDALNAL